jgi:tetratricopeptide (TPR) repeat protein
MPQDFLSETPRAKFIQVLIEQKIGEEPQNPIWPQLLGDFYYSRKNFKEAIKAYEQVLLLTSSQAETLNNLAWLLLTADDPAFIDKKRALMLAQKAVLLSNKPHVLDTLATAYWANGFADKAVAIEREIVAQHPENVRFYQEQIKRFSETVYAPTNHGLGLSQEEIKKP